MTDLLDFADFILDELAPLQKLPVREQAQAFASRVFAEMVKADMRIADWTPALMRQAFVLAWLDGYTAGVVKGQASGQRPVKELFRDVMQQMETRNGTDSTGT